jgi:hypothetical protein
VRSVFFFMRKSYKKQRAALWAARMSCNLCDYLLPGALSVLLPEPMPEPVLPGVALPGVALPGVALPGVALPGVEAPGVEVVPPVVAPPLALPVVPVVMPSSLRHFSRSAPSMPRHLLLEAPLAPDEEAPPDAEAPPEAEVPPEALLPVSLLVLPVAPALAPVELLSPTEEPVLCASETLAIAKRAAAVAVPTNFNIW